MDGVEATGLRAEFPEVLLISSHVCEHDKYLLVTCYLPGTALGVGCTVVNQMDGCPTIVELTF